MVVPLKNYPSPYSPNLNLIERLWKWMKECVMYNVYYEHFNDFRLAVLVFLEQASNFKPKTSFWQQLLSRVREFKIGQGHAQGQGIDYLREHLQKICNGMCKYF